MDNKPNIHKILLKPTWGRMSVSPGNLLKFSANIIEKALNFYQQGGKLFIIQHEPEQDLLAQSILGSLFTKILRLKKEVKLFLPDVEFSRSSVLLSAEFLLVHNLPQFRETLNWLTENSQKQMIIATGTITQWEQVKIDIPVFYYQLFPVAETDWQEYLKIDLENEFESYQRLNPTEKIIFERVLVLDSMGIPIPIDLLANSLNLPVKDAIDSVTEIEEKGLLYCLENEKEAEQLVCSNSSRIASKWIEIETRLTQQLETTLSIIINSVERENKDERYTILNLFQSALGNSFYLAENKILSRAKIRELIKTCREKLAEIWSEGDAIEHLLWGKVLEDLQEFELSAKVFAEGLGRDENNPFLRQAKARMTGKWAIFDSSKLELAKELFSNITNETAQNPYFLQARGVFEHAIGEPQRARDYFKSALDWTVGDESKKVVLTAWANLEIEQANFIEAEEKLNQIQSAEHSPYVQHVRAKLHFYRGNYKEAAKQLKTLFSIHRSNTEGWNMLGEMASKRAHWKKAETALKFALGINSENVPTLRALGDLETNLGRFEIERGNLANARTHFEKARQYFAESIEVEPLNLHSKTSDNVLLRYEGELLKLKGETEKSRLFFETAIENLVKLQKYQINEFIAHNLGETNLALGNFQEAKRYFAETNSLAGLTGLAKAEIGLRDTEAAIEYLTLAEEQLRESNTKHFERVRSFNSIAEVWITLRDLEKAADLTQTSFELDKENGFTLRLYAKICRGLGEEKKANLFKGQAQDLAKQELIDFLLEKE